MSRRWSWWLPLLAMLALTSCARVDGLEASAAPGAPSGCVEPEALRKRVTGAVGPEIGFLNFQCITHKLTAANSAVVPRIALSLSFMASLLLMVLALWEFILMSLRVAGGRGVVVRDEVFKYVSIVSLLALVCNPTFYKIMVIDASRTIFVQLYKDARDALSTSAATRLASEPGAYIDVDDRMFDYTRVAARRGILEAQRADTAGWAAMPDAAARGLELDSLRRMTTEATCRADVRTERGLDSLTVARRVQSCTEAAGVYDKHKTTLAQIAEASGAPQNLGLVDMMTSLAESVANVVTAGLRAVLMNLMSALFGALSAVAGLMFSGFLAIGPIFLVLGATGGSRSLAKDWMKRIVGYGLMPTVLAFTMALFDAFITDGGSKMLTNPGYAVITGLCGILFVPMFLKEASGLVGAATGAGMAGAAALGGMVGATVARGPLTALSQGVGAFSGAREGGASTLSAMGSGLAASGRTAARMAIPGASGATGGMLGAMASAAGGADPSRGFGAGTLVGTGYGETAQEGVSALTRKAAAAAGVTPSATEQKAAGSVAAARAAGQVPGVAGLVEGEDYTVQQTPEGGTTREFTAAGRAKLDRMVAADTLLQRNFGSGAGLGQSEAMQAAISGRVPAAVGSFAPGSVGHQLAHQLPLSVLAKAEGETSDAYATRIQSTVAGLGGVATDSAGEVTGVDYAKAGRSLEALHQTASRTATGRSGAPLGVVADSIRPGQSASYAAEPGSVYAQMQARNTGASGDAVYAKARAEVVKRYPRQSGETDVRYQSRLNQHIFADTAPAAV